MYRIRRKVKIDGVIRNVKCMVIPERKQVIAKLSHCSFDAINAFTRDTGYVPMIADHSLMNDTYSATATCHPEDTFDPEVGADIATEKLIENYIAARSNKTSRMLEYLENHITKVHAKRVNKK